VHAVKTHCFINFMLSVSSLSY